MEPDASYNVSTKTKRKQAVDNKTFEKDQEMLDMRALS